MGSAGAALDVEGLEVSLGRHRVLKEVSFRAAQGEVTALVGPNGAGKSTLLRAAAGLLPYDGRLALLGKAVRSYSAEERARTIAYVPQRSVLTAALPVRSVVAQGRFSHFGWTQQVGFQSADSTKHGEVVAAAMEQTDVRHLSARPFTELSMGERRRVLLARGMATGARVLLLDEPTSALDVRHVLELEALLKRLASDGYAIVVVLHNLAEVRSMADHAVLLREGQVKRVGPVDEVVAAGPVRAAYQVELLEGAGLGYRLPEDARGHAAD